MDSVDNVDILAAMRSRGRKKHVKCWKIIWFGAEKYPHIFGRLRHENMWIMWTVIVLKGFPQYLQRLRRP